MKLLILGIDGATFDLIRPWAREGKLPNLAKLMQHGVHTDLLSTMPPVTSPAWPSFMTGCNPGKHGVFDFIQPSGASYSLVNSSLIKKPTMWQILSNKGYRVGVLNVPVTYPPQPINGFMITGILSPKQGTISYPANLIDRYRGTLGDYRISPNIQYKPGNETAYIEDIYDLIHAHGKWALHLMQNEPVDVLMVHFIALDIMMHALWKLMDSNHPRHKPSAHQDGILGGYQLVDSYIGKMLDLLPADAHVITMSDHGFGPLHRIVNLNNFLMEKGFLKLNHSPKTILKSLAFKLGISPAVIYRIVEKIGLQNMATKVSKNTRNQLLGKFLNYDSVDWSQTVAYSMGHVGQIYLNMAGREPNGIVTQASYKRTRQDIVDALQDLVDENGRSLITKIILREETYHGPYTEKGPDIHLILDGYNIIAYPLFATNGKIVTEQIRGDSGCHRREGIVIAHGPQFKENAQLPISADIIDIAPTIFALLGEAVPKHMDGAVLVDFFKTPPDVTHFDAEQELRDDHTLNEADNKQIEDRLRDLGYL
ncbi:MAG: alkaline phosphatase family protein [Anaerolineales bacterium]|nr:alkaline phosphatase family protein [Anaerolineales bacterium]MCB8940052.1 alkaline phosphatase family protein [Ardenticatenaceae bacterium]